MSAIKKILLDKLKSIKDNRDFMLRTKTEQVSALELTNIIIEHDNNSIAEIESYLEANKDEMEVPDNGINGVFKIKEYFPPVQDTTNDNLKRMR